MEITSFILGVCAVIVLLMIVGTSVNLLSFRTLKRDLTNLERNLDNIHNNIYHELENIREDVEKKEKDLYIYSDSLDTNVRDEMEKLYRHIDSRTDKLDNKFMDEVRLLLLETKALGREIKRVEKGYKEKINY